MTARKLCRLAALLLVLVLPALACGCSALTHLLLSQESDALGFPVLAQEPEYRAPQVSGPGQWIQVDQADDRSVSFHDPGLANLLLAALDNPVSQEELHASCPLTNTITIYSESNELLGQFLLAGDGDRTAALTAEGERFAISPYLYGLLENQMWRQAQTVWSEPLTWDPSNGTAALELRMNHILDTLSVQAYGQMDGYFSTYRMYEPRVSEGEASIYLLRSIACYVMEDGAYVRTVYDTRPVRLTLTSTGANQWVVTGYSQCDGELLSTRPNAAVQAIFPYEMVEQVVYDLSNTDDSPELHQMALDYLRSQGLARTPIQE